MINYPSRSWSKLPHENKHSSLRPRRWNWLHENPGKRMMPKCVIMIAAFPFPNIFFGNRLDIFSQNLNRKLYTFKKVTRKNYRLRFFVSGCYWAWTTINVGWNEFSSVLNSVSSISTKFTINGFLPVEVCLIYTSSVLSESWSIKSSKTASH